VLADKTFGPHRTHQAVEETDEPTRPMPPSLIFSSAEHRVRSQKGLAFEPDSGRMTVEAYTMHGGLAVRH